MLKSVEVGSLGNTSSSQAEMLEFKILEVSEATAAVWPWEPQGLHGMEAMTAGHRNSRN